MKDEFNAHGPESVERKDNESRNGSPSILNQAITPEAIAESMEDGFDETPKGHFTGRELVNRKVEKLPCLIDPILPKTGLAAIVGGSDVGKSSLLRQVALTVASGKRDFLGFEVKATHRRAIYVSSEDDEGSLAYLLRQAWKHFPEDSEGWDRITFVFETEDLHGQLEGLLAEQPADLVILDCFSDLYGRNLNDGSQVRTYMNDFSGLSRKHQCLILFLHHNGKRTGQFAPDKDHAVGSQGFEAKVRIMLELRNDPDQADLRHLTIVKGNYLPPEMKRDSYVLRIDETRCFENTGDRRPIGQLAISKGTETDKLRAEAKRLKASGMPQVEIAKEMGVVPATVSKWINHPDKE